MLEATDCRVNPSDKRWLYIYLFLFSAGLFLGLGKVYGEEKQTVDHSPGRGVRVLHLATEHVITLGAGLTIVGQGMNGDTNDAGLTYSVDIALNGDFAELGKAFIYLNSAEGQGIDTQAATSPNGDNEAGTLDSNGEGFSNTRIAEAWYQIPISATASLTVGKIDPSGIYDGNLVANDETAQFLGDAFINNPAIAFPSYTGGISFSMDLDQSMMLNIGAFEAASEFDGGLDSSFLIAELERSTLLADRPGHVRFIAWLEDVDNNSGVAINMDHQFDSKTAGFLRLGIQDDDQPFDNALSFGAQWQRQTIMIGAAYSLLTATAPKAKDEIQLEAYYRYSFSDHLHLTADIQVIFNPGFNGSADDVTVYGLRGQAEL